MSRTVLFQEKSTQSSGWVEPSSVSNEKSTQLSNNHVWQKQTDLDRFQKQTDLDRFQQKQTDLDRLQQRQTDLDRLSQSGMDWEDLSYTLNRNISKTKSTITQTNSLSSDVRKRRKKHKSTRSSNPSKLVCNNKNVENSGKIDESTICWRPTKNKNSIFYNTITRENGDLDFTNYVCTNKCDTSQIITPSCNKGVVSNLDLNKKESRRKEFVELGGCALDDHTNLKVNEKSKNDRTSNLIYVNNQVDENERILRNNHDRSISREKKFSFTSRIDEEPQKESSPSQLELELIQRLTSLQTNG